MRTAAQVLGDDAEELVTVRLRDAGWTILGRKLRVGRAEIDILAIDRQPPAAVVAVEVRWRRGREFGLPEETVDRAKLARLRVAALTLREGAALTGIPVPRLPVRIDIMAVEPGGVVRHYRHVG
jgi:Holliday junction resolvase-like predicted endonuclease